MEDGWKQSVQVSWERARYQRSSWGDEFIDIDRLAHIIIHAGLHAGIAVARPSRWRSCNNYRLPGQAGSEYPGGFNPSISGI